MIPPGAGSVPHTHTKEDETIFVLEGELRAWLGGKQYDMKAGDFVHMPRGVQHYFKNVSDEPTRLLLSYTPGGFEQWFLDVGKPFVGGFTRHPLRRIWHGRWRGWRIDSIQDVYGQMTKRTPA